MTPTTLLSSFPTTWWIQELIAMARAPNTKSVKQGPARRQATRSAEKGRSRAAKTKAGKEPGGTAKQASPAAPVRTVSKDELRAQVEKLERANAALRAKSREATRAAKLSATRIAELEDEVARLRGQPPGTTDSHSAGSSNSGPQERDIDPGDAVPPGVAPEDPNPPDQEADIARENLEAHLRGK
jgi:hypothetical protein